MKFGFSGLARVRFARLLPTFPVHLRKAKHEALNRGRGTRGLPVSLDLSRTAFCCLISLLKHQHLTHLIF